MDFKEILRSKPHNSHQLERYIRFIESQKNSGVGVEKHHICPKSSDMFPEFKSLSKHSWNSKVLTYRQHVIAHYMLHKAYPDSFGCALAVTITANRHLREKTRFDSRMVAESKKRSYELRIGKRFYRNEEGLVKMFESHPGEGWVEGVGKRTVEQNKRNSEAQKGLAKGKRFWTDGTNQIRSTECPGEGWYLGCSPEETTRRSARAERLNEGTRWYTNGIESKKIRDCPEGWVPGRSSGGNTRAKGNSYATGFVWWNDGSSEKKTKECPGMGWTRGRIKK